MNKIILVTGATGQQGGAAARQLLAHEFEVRAFTRNPESDAARNLHQLGAEIFKGDMSSEVSLTEAMKDVYGVFSVQPPSWVPSPESDEREAQLGMLVADVVKKCGVQHLVYSSVFGSELQADYRPKFKYTIEEYIWKSGLPATVFKPAVFMENFYLPNFGLSEAKIYNATPFDLPSPYISVEDIGVFVRLAFQRPKGFIGKTINLAGDTATVSEVSEILSRNLGKQITPVQIPVEAVKEQNELLGKLMETVYTHGYPKIDLDTLRLLHPKLLTFENWVNQYARKRLQELLNN